MKSVHALALALLMLVTVPAWSATRAGLVVEGVQMPAWAERASGAREPLAVGMTLGSKERVITGPGSRALLRLADGSLVKLGENGMLALDDIGRSRLQARDVVTATLDVLSGAFRFTTQALNSFRGERDVKVRIVTLTAGIRGTDLWGKAEKGRDIVCLIEGSVTVARGGDAFTMDQPMSFYIAPRNAPPLPVARVSKQQLDEWAKETDIAAGAGAARKGGKWRVYAAEAANQDDALAIYDQLRSAGYAAEIRPVNTETAQVFRLRISGLSSRKDAEALATKLQGQPGVGTPRVSM